ncbi:MAG TPA: response regulator transcription factor [Desulfarculaceae bacterium]|nr:response regulator transcription factor [Desulfarculaceae bacterium]
MVLSDSKDAASWLIYIAGSAKLQSELLVVFIEKETGLPCRIDNTQNMFPTQLVSERRSIIFSDCRNRSAKAIVAGLRDFRPQGKADVFVILFNLDNSLKIEDKLLELGIWGIFYEDDPLENMPLGVEAICKGEIWLSRQVMSDCLTNMRRQHNYNNSSAEKAILTEREDEVLKLLSAGSSNNNIAADMNISIHTVRSHLYHIFRKIGVSSRHQASIWARQNL